MIIAVHTPPTTWPFNTALRLPEIKKEDGKHWKTLKENFITAIREDKYRLTKENSLCFKCLNPTRRIFHIGEPEVRCWNKGCDWHYLTCDNSIHWPLTSEGGWAGGSACGQVGGWVSLLDRLDERLGGRLVVGGGWWVKLGGWLKVMVGG